MISKMGRRKYYIYIPLILLAILYAFPFYWMLLTAVKPDDEIFKYPPLFYTKRPVWKNFYNAITAIPFLRYTINTIIVAGASTIATIIASPLAAYSFARTKWKGRDTLFLITLAVMMIPSQVTIVPLFVVFTRLKMINSFVPLILPKLFGTPYYIFFLRQFFKQLPQSLEDAARIDGSNEMQIYLKIMLPLCQPAIISIAIFQFVASWNDFMGPLIYLNDENKYTLQIGLQQFKQSTNTQWSLLMSAAALVSLPIVVLYFLIQGKFVEGITFGGIKG